MCFYAKCVKQQDLKHANQVNLLGILPWGGIPTGYAYVLPRCTGQQVWNVLTAALYLEEIMHALGIC